MRKYQAMLIAIECLEATKKNFSLPKDSPIGTPRREEDQEALNAAIEDIDKALIVLKHIRDFVSV